MNLSGRSLKPIAVQRTPAALDGLQSESCPQRVEKLVLIDSIGYSLKHNFVAWLLKLPGVGKFLLALCDKDTLEWILKKGVFFDPSMVTDEEIEGWIRPYYVKGAVQAALELRNFDFVIGKNIKDILCPVLIIWGQDDKCLPVKFSSKRAIKPSKPFFPAGKIFRKCSITLCFIKKIQKSLLHTTSSSTQARSAHSSLPLVR